MEADGFIAREDGFITITFMPELPALQTHHKIDMVSVPSMTQEEYEKSMLELGPLASYPDDDIINIVCPGEMGGDVVRKFTMRRSSLQRSATLNQFFESKGYRFGCGMTLHFTQVPGVSFSLVKDYLDKGPDRYTKADMISNVSHHYSNGGKRLEVYSRLYKCARQLELVGLKMMAWAAIRDEDKFVSAEDCVTLASFIFADQAGFGAQLKNWLLGHIRRYFEVLNANPVIGVEPDTTWNELVNMLSPSFRKEWKNLVSERKSRLSMVEEEQDENEQLFARVLKSLDAADLDRAERAIRTVKDEKSAVTPPVEALPNGAVTEVMEINAEKEVSPEKEESDEWEDLDNLCPGPESSQSSRAADDSKAREVLGAPLLPPRVSTSTEPSPRHTSVDMETAKARLVMGINSPSKGTIAGRRKQPAYARAAKSLTNLIRTPAYH